jgi:hypothetical protein
MPWSSPEKRKEYERTHRKQIAAAARRRYAENPEVRKASAEYSAEWQKANRDKCNASKNKCVANNAQEYRDKNKRYRDNNPEQSMLSQAKYRAKKRGLDFDLELFDIVIPEVCPVFGTTLARGCTKKGKSVLADPNSPSLDRIDSSKGYVKGNVWVISNRANKLKNDGTLDELKLLVAALEKKLLQALN